MIYEENKFIVDDTHKSRFQDGYFETTYWHDIGDGVKWRNHKHWGMGVWGAEGCLSRHGDRSGCVTEFGGLDYIPAPIAVEQRHYKKGGRLISAVFSYPNGLSIENEYFWEIYCLNGGLMEDVERFFGKDGEEKMEKRIKKLLTQKKGR